MQELNQILITIQQCHNGMYGISLPPITGQHIIADVTRHVGRTRTINGFSAKSNNRLKQRLQTTAFHIESSVAITLPFNDNTTPKKAKVLYARMRKWILRKNPRCFGFYSVEFKNKYKIHYHLIVCLNVSRVDIAFIKAEFEKKWRHISALSANTVFYIEPIADLSGYLSYLSKADHQRKIPACFSNQMTRFWGEFGQLPRCAQKTLQLPASNQYHAREMLADILGRQNHRRAEAISNAIRRSSGAIFVWLTPEEVDTLSHQIIAFSESAA